MRTDLTDADVGGCPQLPDDFEPQRSAPMHLDDPLEPNVGPWLDKRRGDPEPSLWYGCTGREAFDRVIGPALLITALLGAVASCVFGGGRS